MHLILASASPRRLELLRQLGLEPEVRAADIDETPRADESPTALVRRLARAKGRAIGERAVDGQASGGQAGGKRATGPTGPGTVVLAADTVIDLDGRALGKPAGRDEGIGMLLALGGREHRVVTGVCLVRGIGRSGRDDGGRRAVGARTVAVTTRVRFGRIDADAAARYWDSGEPAGKAGAYAIQGRGARFVAGIIGSYSNVVGLPLHETARLLAAVDPET